MSVLRFRLPPFGHCVVCPPIQITSLWPLCCLSSDSDYLPLVIVLSVLRFRLPPFGHCVVCPPIQITSLWPLCCLSSDSDYLPLAIVLSVLRFRLPPFGHCVVCPPIQITSLWPLCCLSSDSDYLPLISSSSSYLDNSWFSFLASYYISPVVWLRHSLWSYYGAKREIANGQNWRSTCSPGSQDKHDQLLQCLQNFKN